MNKSKRLIVSAIIVLLLLAPVVANADLKKDIDKQTIELDKKLTKLEEYVAKMNSKLKKFDEKAKPKVEEKIADESKK